MKRLSISLVFVGLVFGLVFGSVVGYADTQANVFATFTLDSVLNVMAGGEPSLGLTQDMIETASTDNPQQFSGDVTVTVQSLSTYNLYAAYKMDSGNINDLVDATNQDSFLSLDDGGSNMRTLNHHNFNGDPSSADGSFSPLTQLSPWGNLNGGVDISGEQQAMGLYLDLTQLNGTSRDATDSYTFHLGFFVEET